MTGRKLVISLTVLCALLVSAFAAQAASAAGTTAHTCKNSGTFTKETDKFTGPHCIVVDNVNGTYGHVEIPANTKTELIGDDTNETEEHQGAILKSTIAGSAIELVAKKVSGSGSMENSESGGEMKASGEGKIVYSEVSEKLLGCTVTGLPGGAGTVETKQLSASTAGAGMGLKFVPTTGTIFAEFELTGCVVGPLTVTVRGSVLGVPEGATTKTTHAKITEEKSLRLQSASGPIAGIAGGLTLKARANSSQGYTALAATT